MSKPETLPAVLMPSCAFFPVVSVPILFFSRQFLELEQNDPISYDRWRPPGIIVHYSISSLVGLRSPEMMASIAAIELKSHGVFS